MLNVLVACEESAGLQLLRELEKTDYHVAGVLTSPPSDNRHNAKVWDFATNLGHKVWPAVKVTDPAYADVIRETKADILLNVHSLYIICKEVLEAPRLGCFNLHPGPLPQYAGLNVPSWAIYNGEQRHGVTLHRMLPDIDTGDIAFEEIISIDADETALSLSFKCVKAGVPLLFKLLDAATRGENEIPRKKQDLTKRGYFTKAKVPNGGQISWSQNAEQIHNLIRACDYFPFSSPWGQAHTSLGDKLISVIKTELSDLECNKKPGSVRRDENGDTFVACGDKWLRVQKLQCEGKSLPAEEVLEDGMCLGDSVLA